MNISRNILMGLLLLCLLATWGYYFYNKGNTIQQAPASPAQPAIVSDDHTIIQTENADSSVHAVNDSLIKVVNDLKIRIDSLETKNHRLKRLIKYGE
jgi:hypothetical protein